MSKYAQPADQQSRHSSADMQRMDAAKPGEPAHLSQEPQSRSEAQNLLLLQDYVAC